MLSQYRADTQASREHSLVAYEINSNSHAQTKCCSNQDIDLCLYRYIHILSLRLIADSRVVNLGTTTKLFNVICPQATSGTRRGSFQAENWIKEG